MLQGGGMGSGKTKEEATMVAQTWVGQSQW